MNTTVAGSTVPADPADAAACRTAADRSAASCLATRSAITAAPPDDTPQKMPSSLASRRVMSSAACWLTSSTRSMRACARMAGS